MKQVVLRISPNAEMELRVEGTCGVECKDITAPIKAALGVVTESEETAEMHQATQTQEVEQ